MPSSSSSSKLLPFCERSKRRYDLSFKQKLVRQTYETQASLATIAAEHGVNSNMLWLWHKQYEAGELGLISQPELLPMHVEQDASAFKPGLDAGVPIQPSEACIDFYIGHAKLVLRGNPQLTLLSMSDTRVETQQTRGFGDGRKVPRIRSTDGLLWELNVPHEP